LGTGHRNIRGGLADNAVSRHVLPSEKNIDLHHEIFGDFEANMRVMIQFKNKT
jgi:hypothetical protein